MWNKAQVMSIDEIYLFNTINFEKFTALYSY